MPCIADQKEAAMIHTALLRLVAVTAAGVIALGAMLPAHAKSDWQINQAPTWFDQTVYRPNCVSADCGCECRAERACLPACPR